MLSNINASLAALFILLFASIPIQQALEEMPTASSCDVRQIHVKEVGFCFGIILPAPQVAEVPVADVSALRAIEATALTQEEEKELGYMAIAVLAGIIILAMIIHAVIGANRRKKR